ncbi:MAG: beta-N-acetylhexosaminidase [Deltaproteobacteria bacterium]|nr:beta-N-acetylhexosaminidase [Deltaproteobacteria bacterium]PWB62603.1 MAG: beta-N-acetylhexosaminidase [Deltaproteobacteria bacterium]
MTRLRVRYPAPPFLMVGFEGKSVTPALSAWLRDGTASGVILFTRNLEDPRQVKELCREIRAAAGRGRPAPLIAIDQEGGRVTRLKDPAFTQFPPARSYSILGGRAEEAAAAAGAALAGELSAVGIDINFAPVLDVDSNPVNPVIGDRSLSGDPEEVARIGIAFVRGTLSRNVLPVGKHFPGHGHTETDSHKVLPVVRSPRRTLHARDIHPFERAIRAGIPALMTAHVVYPALDPDYPATLSRKILTGLLRGRLRFRGAVFSDALEMKAISLHYGVGDAAVLAFRAGCDAVIVSRGETEQAEAAEALARWAGRAGSSREAASRSRRRMDRIRRVLSHPAGRRTSLRSVGKKGHRALAQLLLERWENSGRTSSDDKSCSIGER